LRMGFTQRRRSPDTLVVSYTTVSPLPGRNRAVCSLLHWPAGCPGWVLPTIPALWSPDVPQPLPAATVCVPALTHPILPPERRRESPWRARPSPFAAERDEAHPSARPAMSVRPHTMDG